MFLWYIVFRPQCKLAPRDDGCANMHWQNTVWEHWVNTTLTGHAKSQFQLRKGPGHVLPTKVRFMFHPIDSRVPNVVRREGKWTAGALAMVVVSLITPKRYVGQILVWKALAILYTDSTAVSTLENVVWISNGLANDENKWGVVRVFGTTTPMAGDSKTPDGHWNSWACAPVGRQRVWFLLFRIYYTCSGSTSAFGTE